MLRQDRWANLRREIERILGYSPGTTDPTTTTDWALNEVLLEDIHRLNQYFTTEAIKDWDRIGQGSFTVFVHAYVAECWRYISESN